MATPDKSPPTPITILLVEPNTGDSRLFAESLADAKFTNSVHTVSDGEAALEYLRERADDTDELHPDLVLLEPRLPKTNGHDISTQLAADPAFRDIPVVVLTSSEVGEDILRSQGFEADHYVQKPLEPVDFLDVAREIETFWLTIVDQPTET